MLGRRGMQSTLAGVAILAVSAAGCTRDEEKTGSQTVPLERAAHTGAHADIEAVVDRIPDAFEPVFRPAAAGRVHGVRVRVSDQREELWNLAVYEGEDRAARAVTGRPWNRGAVRQQVPGSVKFRARIGRMVLNGYIPADRVEELRTGLAPDDLMTSEKTGGTKPVRKHYTFGD